MLTLNYLWVRSKKFKEKKINHKMNFIDKYIKSLHIAKKKTKTITLEGLGKAPKGPTYKKRTAAVQAGQVGHATC